MSGEDFNTMYPTEVSEKNIEIEELKDEIERKKRIIKELHYELRDIDPHYDDVLLQQENRFLEIRNRKNQEIEKWKQYYSTEMLKRDVKITKLEKEIERKERLLTKFINSQRKINKYIAKNSDDNYEPVIVDDVFVIYNAN
jgi:hypothetical protein